MPEFNPSRVGIIFKEVFKIFQQAIHSDNTKIILNAKIRCIFDNESYVLIRGHLNTGFKTII